MLTPYQILSWYHDAGVDEIIDEEPHNRFVVPPVAQMANARVEQPAPAPAKSTPIAHKTAASFNVDSPSEGIAKARAVADSCNSIAELEQAVRTFEGCSLKKAAQNTVFADGNPDAPILLIGEAPGASEDAQGIPFCGASGKLLDEMLKAISLDRTSTYISNTIYWRPPGNRQPSIEELEICRPFVERLIALSKPKLLILVGGTATKALLDKETGITRLRGKFYRYSNCYLQQEITTGVLYHPSYLLRQPSHKRFAWQDLLRFQQFIRSGYQSPSA